MAVNLSPVGGVAVQFFTNDGAVLSGGKIYTYAAGTNTPQATYTTSAGNIAHTNPIILNSAGRVPTGEIWLTDGLTYKFVINDSSDVLIGTYDNIIGINSNFVNFTNEQEIQTATAGQTVFTLTTMQYQPATGSLSVFVDGVNQYGPGAQYAYIETSSTVVTFISGLHVGASVKFTTSAINASSYGDASQIAYTPAGAGAVTTNVQTKLRESVSLADFGGVQNGTTDDTAAWNLMIANAPSGATCLISGPSLISSTIVVNRKLQFEFQGSAAVALTELPHAYILKKSTMTTAGLQISYNGFVMRGGGVVGQTGNTGDGIQVLANNVTLYNPCGINCGGNGMRIGSDSVGINANTFCIIKPVCSQNIENGIYIDDEGTPSGPDANAGTLINPFCQGNGLDGIRIKNAVKNTIIGPLLEENTGAGLRIQTTGQYITAVGGDYEGNIAGDIIIEAGSSWNQLISPGVLGTITDNGQSTTIINRQSIQSGTLAGAVFNNGPTGASYSGSNECYVQLNGDANTRAKFGWSAAAAPLTGLIAGQVMHCQNTMWVTSRDTVSGKVRLAAGTGLTAFVQLDPQNLVFEISGVDPKFSGTNSTGSSTPALGSNFPGVTTTAPYTWIRAKAADGTTIYIPAWK
jgi:hypothetical protein